MITGNVERSPVKYKSNYKIMVVYFDSPPTLTVHGSGGLLRCEGIK